MMQTGKRILSGCRLIVLAGTCLMLSGCVAAVAPLLSLGGAVSSVPVVQVAATAFSVGEYCYEYSVNDRNPVEVVEYKIAGVNEFLTGDSSKATPEQAPVMLAETEMPQERAAKVRRRIELRRLAMRSIEARRVAFNRSVSESVSLKWAPPRSVDLHRGAEGDVRLR